MVLFHNRKKTSNARRLTSNAEIQNLPSVFGFRRCDFDVSLHPLRDFDAEKIQPTLQHSRGEIG
jgi:hypothetical protein